MRACIGPLALSFCLEPVGVHARVQRSPHQRVCMADQASHAIVHRCLRYLARTCCRDEGIIGIDDVSHRDFMP